jgi:hypothetical protein
MSSRCYRCESIATTVEHVPPQCLFPEKKDLPHGIDLRKNLFTVPSCPEHNLGKSGDDEYLMYVLTMNLPAEKLAEYHFSSKVLRAINRRPSLFNSITEKTSPVTVHDVTSNEVFDTLAIEVNRARLEQALGHVAHGLYRYHFGKPWLGPLRVYPEFLRFIESAQAPEWNDVLQQMSSYGDLLFKDAAFHGENATVFSYQVVLVEGQIPVALRMHFYSGVKVLVLFGVAGG